jgi:hypothetical protein
VLAVAAVATAWSTYQSTQWRGQQAADNSTASAARIESSQASTGAGQLTQVDIAPFTQWANADVAGNDTRTSTCSRSSCSPPRSSSRPCRPKFRTLRPQEVLLAVGGLILLGAAVFVATFPVMFVT